MQLKLNKGLWPIKAHFFFFFAALGPVLPQMNVFGRQLGVSAATMGMVTAVLPLLWAAAKPMFGYLVDYFTNLRKYIFMALITVMTGSFCCLYFLSTPQDNTLEISIEKHVYYLNNTIQLEKVTDDIAKSMGLEKFKCQQRLNDTQTSFFEIWFSNSTYINTIYLEEDVKNTSCSLLLMDFDSEGKGEVTCKPKVGSELMCLDYDIVNKSEIVNQNIFTNLSATEKESKIRNIYLNLTSDYLDNGGFKNEPVFILNQNGGGEKLATGESGSLYMTPTFWLFVVLMSLGTISFNVANCIGDAVCFDVLGDNTSAYGSQRAWGTVGYGITALLSGALVDLYSDGGVKEFAPAFLLALAFTAMDLVTANKLKGYVSDKLLAHRLTEPSTPDSFSRLLRHAQELPSLSSPQDSGKALRNLLMMPRVLVFILFAVLAGVFDSFIVYYMFWFLEELSEISGHSANVKLIEGVVVAAQSFGGELLFFFLSGRIINRFGYGKTMSFCFFCYALRLALISFICNPWQLVAIEVLMQGPTYALCYSCIVGYAAQMAPAGYSATVQGLVAGMDDGLGYGLGSLIGGIVYSRLGARTAFRLMAGVAATAAVAHVIFTAASGVGKTEQKEKSPQIAEAEKMLENEAVLFDNNPIYKDTVVRISSPQIVESDR